MKPKILITRTLFDEIADALSQRFEVDYNRDSAHLSPEQLRRRLADKEGVLVVGDRIDAEAVADAPKLRAVCNVAVGYNNLDLAALSERGILATNTPGVLDDTTADLTFALILAAARRLTEAERLLRSGKWQGLVFDLLLGVDVHHATLGIVGMGRIGQAVARRARGFGMRLLYHNRHRVPRAVERELGARYVSLAELLRRSDFVSLNLPYSPEAHHLIGARELSLMKPNAVLVNVARGGIVDDAALAEALAAGRIFAAGLDVYEGEPRVHPALLARDNVVLAPHIGSATRATRLAMARLAAKNLLAALSGRRPPNLLNPEAWKKRRR